MSCSRSSERCERKTAGVEVGNEWVEEGSPPVDLGSEADRKDPDQRFAVETSLDRLLSEPNTLGRTERRSAGAALPPAASRVGLEVGEVFDSGRPPGFGGATPR
jgi:hypothetical protein